jgi:F-type H+-transporting ATPase subunit b
VKELLKNFGIDWRLLMAQAVNFFVLLFVLWRFAYKPILSILRKRREDIEKGIRDAKAAEEKLARIGALQEEKLDEARREALAVVNQAQALARRQKDEMMAEAGRRGEALIAKAKRAIAEEKSKLSDQLQREARGLVRDGVARVLHKMPPQERDRELIEEAMRAMKT